MIALLTVLACAAADPVAVSPPPVSADAPKVPTLLGDAPGIVYVGDWTSPPCPGRAFARNIHFEADGNYAAMDLVSPCPVGTQCAWSGITAYQGIWEQQHETLELRDMGGTPAPGPHPTSFRANDKGQLVENGCPYNHGLTVPDGYTIDKVTPKVVR